MRPGLALRILYVEDDPELREVFGEILSDHGYEVVPAENADQGLRELRQQRFDLVLSDYMLPDETGGWMLQQASREGLLRGAATLIITAHPSPTGAAGVRVLRKPVDIDYFLNEIDAILEPARMRLVDAAKQRLDHAVERSEGARAPRIELALYISASSPSSLRALRNMDKILADYDASQVSFTVCDLSKELSSTVEEDRIVFTPTLVKRAPEPRTWIVGDLEEERLVLDLLGHAGVERRR